MLIGLGGCQSDDYFSGARPDYPYAKAADSDLAVVSLGGRHNVYLQRVDGLYTPSLRKRFLLPPGRHDLLLTCEHTIKPYFGREQLRFKAEAGHEYEVRTGTAAGRRCTMELVDKSTKAIVSNTIHSYQPRGSIYRDSARQ